MMHKLGDHFDLSSYINQLVRKGKGGAKGNECEDKGLGTDV